MRLLCLIVILLLPSWSWASKECEARIAQAQAELTEESLLTETLLTERVMTEEVVTMGKKLDVKTLIGLELPKGYAENREAFLAARQKAQTELLPRLEKLRAGMDLIGKTWTFRERLWWLADQYDQSVEEQDKTVALATMLRMFSIPVEHYYIELITTRQGSVELKTRLAQALEDIFFKTDPSWTGPLNRALHQVNLPSVKRTREFDRSFLKK